MTKSPSRFYPEKEDILLNNLVDIRKELRAVLSTSFQWYGLRKTDYTKPCSCSDLSDGIRTPANCSRCMQIGYLFTDFLIKGYAWQGSFGVEFNSGSTKLTTQQKNIIVEHQFLINKFDHILELDQYPDTGKIKQPFKIIKLYSVQDIMPIRGEEGRYEFWRGTIEERNFSDGRPGQIGTENLNKGNRSSGGMI